MDVLSVAQKSDWITIKISRTYRLLQGAIRIFLTRAIPVISHRISNTVLLNDKCLSYLVLLPPLGKFCEKIP